MKYDYIVKSGGVYYAAGEEIPEVEAAEVENVETKNESENPEKGVDELPFSDSDIQMETEPARRGRPRKSDM